MDHRRNDRLIGLWHGLSGREGGTPLSVYDRWAALAAHALAHPSLWRFAPSLALAPLGVNVGGLLGTCAGARACGWCAWVREEGRAGTLGRRRLLEWYIYLQRLFGFENLLRMFTYLLPCPILDLRSVLLSQPSISNSDSGGGRDRRGCQEIDRILWEDRAVRRRETDTNRISPSLLPRISAIVLSDLLCDWMIKETRKREQFAMVCMTFWCCIGCC